MSLNQQNQTTILYKKYLGTGDAYPTASYAQEAPGNARQRVYPSIQICTQAVPSIAPVDLVSQAFSYGQKYTSIAYPWIAKYTNVQLAALSPGISYWFKSGPT